MASTTKRATLSMLGSFVFAAFLVPVKARLPEETVEPWGASSSTRSDWARMAPADGGVPSSLFVRAMTSLPSHYRDNLDLLDAHLKEEHESNAAESPNVQRAHLCCGDYRYGREVRAGLIEAASADTAKPGNDEGNATARGGGGVRAALNHREGYCAIAHLTPSVAASAPTLIHESARCSPLTPASKEPQSLVSPAGFTRRGPRDDGRQTADAERHEASFFGMTLGESMQDGHKRGLVVSMSPGSFSTKGASAGTRGGAGRKLSNSENRAGVSSPAVKDVEQRWRASWSGARGRNGAKDFAERIPWTNSNRSGNNGRRLTPEDGKSWAGRFHGSKAQGYKAALEHLQEKMDVSGELALSEACGFDNIEFVHARNDVLYLRGIHESGHDDETAAACLLGLVGFLSAQPDVMHIHPEPPAEANNKVLTAYVEGGSETETPMRTAGLDGSGQVIGVADTGLDDMSCFFKDDENGMVPRTTIDDALFYPDQRKVIQYIMYADDLDGDGHGTHVSGIAAGAVYDGWEEPWNSQVSAGKCEDVDYVRTCFGDCVYELEGGECHWNPELSCPQSSCDEDTSCDDDTGYPFPCFGDPVDEIPAAAGMAPGSKLSMFDMGTADDGLILPNNLGDIWSAQHSAGARILSNSWSLVTKTEPTDRDVELDEWINDNPDSIILFGAGNNGFEDGQFRSGSIQSPATSKTAMTIGASNSGPDRAYGYFTGADYAGVRDPGSDVDFEVSPYSARGPVGRFTAKPDVVAPGLMVHSAKSSRSSFHEETCALESYGGTSMSAPAVAGAAALIRQYFSQGMLADYLDDKGLCDDGVHDEAGLCEAFEPSGFLVKAVLINSAQWLGNMQSVSYEDKTEWMTVLDFAQGFGAVQMASGIPTSESKIGAFFHENELASDELFYYSIYLGDADKDLSVTVAWYDAPASVASYNLLHDLDMFVMSVDSRKYFRANSYNTLVAMCVDDESCAQKYEFTFHNSLADDLNTVERIHIDADELEEGYYVIGVRARSITESDTQAYGLAVAGGGCELHDMAEYWDELGAETQSGAGGGAGSAEPDPEEGNTGTPAPVGTSSSSSSTGSSSGSASDVVLAPPETPSPTEADPGSDAEVAISGTDPPKSSSFSTTAGDGFRSSSTSGRDGGNSGSTSDESVSVSSAGYGVIGGDDDSDKDEPPTGGADGSGGSVVGQDNSADGIKTTVIIAASVGGAAVLIALGMCLALRRRQKGGSRGGGVPFVGSSKGGKKKVAIGDSSVLNPEDFNDDDIREFEMEIVESSEYEPAERREGRMCAILPSYATAVAMDESAVLRTSTGTPIGSTRGSGSNEHAQELNEDGTPRVDAAATLNESETSGFYAAVEPSAIAKLVGWGIGRDFARVALRQTDNDIPAALKMVAEGDMDAKLAEDHAEMARLGAAAAATAQAPNAAAGND